MKYIECKPNQQGCCFIKLCFFLILSQVIFANFVLANSQPSVKGKQDIRDAIVKIYAVTSKPNYFSPWKIGDPENSTGSGCVISGERILTNAHVISNQKFIQVQLYGQSKRYNAHVLYVSHEADLALLSVEDKSFFLDTTPLQIGTLPNTLQEVLVYGFPTGGESLSITKGILSRIEYHTYAHSDFDFLTGQIDAAINPGNSGGPVIVDDRIVGIAMQNLSADDTENIGYMIPAPIINHFLIDIADEKYDGFPILGFTTQKMENPDMKDKYSMKDGQTGVLVNHVYWNSSAQGNISKNDVILFIDGHQISDDGTIEFRPKERTTYSYYSDIHQIGGTIKLIVLRNGKIKNISYPLNQTGYDFELVAPKQYDKNPQYFIFAGIVFSPLTQNLLCEWEDCNPSAYLNVHLTKKPTKDMQEVIVAVQVLPDDINKGYHDKMALIITEVNGQKFNNFNDFYRLVKTSNSEFISFEDNQDNEIVIDRIKAEESHERILKTYNIESDSSPDMKSFQASNYKILGHRP